MRGYPTLKFFVNGRDMEYAGGRMWDNIVAWVEKKAGPILVELQSAEEVNVFFDAKAREATPTGADPISFDKAAARDIIWSFSIYKLALFTPPDPENR